MLYRFWGKRLIDQCFATLGCLILIPVLLFLMLVLSFANNSAGVFFIQRRTGFLAKTFPIYKFKTMTDDRDESGRLLPDEKRLTKVGKFIRTTSLDELPQLLNIVRGEMSFIGPRPLLEKYIPLYSPEQFRRHEVRPGITGWAQVNGRNAISWEERLALDVYYVDHLSFWLDLKILWLTLVKVIKREGINNAGSATMPPFQGNQGAAATTE